MSAAGVHELFSFITDFHHNEKLQKFDICTEQLNPTLRPYQVDAVQWMLNREKGEPLRNIMDSGGDIVEYPPGGILADEMGLGKTVEVLACIVSNRFEDKNQETDPQTIDPSQAVVLGKRKSEDSSQGDEIQTVAIIKQIEKKCAKPEKKSSYAINSEKYAALKEWYNTSLAPSSVKRKIVDVSDPVQCYCTIPPDSEMLTCQECGTEQHAVCVGADENSDNYFCPRCWITKEPIKSRATFIVSPNSISMQWVTEINKHVNDPNFKVFVYEGVKGNKYIQPTVLADNDVVLTTYQVLCTEFNYAQEENIERKLRHAKRYHSAVTPLTCIHWWRLCIDEAQMVEGSTSKTAMMVRNINANYRWAVSGTPIQKSLHDLFGLIQFLRLEPFTLMSEWNSLVFNKSDFHSVIAPIMWRNSKNDVYEMLGIPPQTTKTHWLKFSPIEAYFYRVMYAECSTAFNEKIRRFHELDVPIKSLDRKRLNGVLYPLLRLRQSCTHPQVIKGKYVKFKHTMTMDELITEMVKNAKLEVDAALRQMVSALNGLAGIHQIDHDYGNAVSLYRRVLQLAEDYANVTKVDSLQMIHTTFNLAELFERHNAGNSETLRQKATALEDEYLKKHETNLLKMKELCATLTTTVETICDGKTLGYTPWWENLINWTENKDELLNRIAICLEDNVIPGHTNLADRMKNLPSVHREIATWLANTDSYRIAAITSLKELYKIPREVLTSSAVDCHLNLKAQPKKNSTNVCPLCKTEKCLKKYESSIFSVISKSGGDDFGSDEEDFEAEMPDSDDKTVASLKDVNFFKTKKEGSWKPSQHERVLYVLANFAKSKRAPNEWIEDASKHLTLFETVRKEFKSLRAEWRHLCHTVDARDELAMAKLRLRLPTLEEQKKAENSKKKKNKYGDVFIIEPHEVRILDLELKNDVLSSENVLKMKSGVLLYLKNLQENGNAVKDGCPVCQEALTDKWSVLQCGHCICIECIPLLIKMSHLSKLECPLCRVATPKDGVSYVVNKNEEMLTEGEQDKSLKSCSSKVRAVVMTVKELLLKDPSVKILIFSTWEKVLDVVGAALSLNNISFRRLGNINKYKNALSQFKTGEGVTALLLPLSLGSKGLNIIEATHLFLVEPILNPADELQALGRIHRIGQTRPTFVHRFAIQNTIEEKMLSCVDSVTWADGNASLSELNSLFEHVPEDNREKLEAVTIE